MDDTHDTEYITHISSTMPPGNLGNESRATALTHAPLGDGEEETASELSVLSGKVTMSSQLEPACGARETQVISRRVPDLSQRATGELVDSPNGEHDPSSSFNVPCDIHQSADRETQRPQLLGVAVVSSIADGTLVSRGGVSCCGHFGEHSEASLHDLRPDPPVPPLMDSESMPAVATDRDKSSSQAPVGEAGLPDPKVAPVPKSFFRKRSVDACDNSDAASQSAVDTGVSRATSIKEMQDKAAQLYAEKS